MRRHRFGRIAAPPAHDESRHQAGKAGIDVHDGSAGKVEHAGIVEEPVRSPNEVRDRRIDADAPQPDEPQQCRELHAIGKGAADQRRGNDRKRHLKAHIDRLRNGLGQIVNRVERHPI